MDLIWLGRELLVAGPDTMPHLSDPIAGRQVVGLRFAPGVAPLVLGVPAHELRDLRVPLDRIWDPAQVRILNERVAATGGAATELQAIARARLRSAQGLPSDLAPLVAMAGSGRRIAEIASELNLSERQLHRRSLIAFGYGPKVLARILRFVRASALVRGGASRAEAAALSGYADQAHMTREFRAFTKPAVAGRSLA
jgi:AraC-like DNA-binding protein